MLHKFVPPFTRYFKMPKIQRENILKPHQFIMPSTKLQFHNFHNGHWGLQCGNLALPLFSLLFSQSLWIISLSSKKCTKNIIVVEEFMLNKCLLQCICNVLAHILKTHSSFFRLAASEEVNKSEQAGFFVIYFPYNASHVINEKSRPIYIALHAWITSIGLLVHNEGRSIKLWVFLKTVKKQIWVCQ